MGHGLVTIPSAPTGFSVSGAAAQSFKFYPGIRALSGNVNGSPSPNGNGRNAGEMTMYKTTHAGFNGMRFTYTWRNFENATQGTYSFQSVIDDFNALQAAVPGSYFGAYVLAGISMPPITYAQAVARVVSLAIPDYILNCGGTLAMKDFYGASTTTNYTLAAQQNGQYGFTFVGWNLTSANTYNSVNALFNDPAVIRGWINMMVAFANTSFVTTAGPYAGQTFTFNTHPLFDGVIDANEWSIALNLSSDQFNPPASSGPASAPTYQNFRNYMFQSWNEIQAAWTQTSLRNSYSFGYSGTTSSTGIQIVADIPNIAKIPGMFMSAPDFYGAAWRSSIPWADNGQQGMRGILNPQSGAGSSLQPATGPVFVNWLGYEGQVQDKDYSSKLDSGNANSSAAAVTDIINAMVALQCQIWVFCMFDQTFSNTFYLNVLAPTIANSIAQPNATRPLLLPPAPVFAATTSPPYPNAMVGVGYDYTVQTEYGFGTLSFVLDVKPAWMNINAATGQITGSPTSPGSVTFSGHVTDGLGRIANF